MSAMDGRLSNRTQATIDMNALQLDANPIESPLLTLFGDYGYAIQGSRIAITVGEIANRREPGNLSGTLALELWALEKPYVGGQFAGFTLAATTIGELRGGHLLAGCHYDLMFREPPAGQWHLALMLREWEGAGYVTRDWVNFNLPYCVADKPVVTRSEADNVINVVFFKNKNPAPQTAGVEPAAAPDSPALAKPAANQTKGVSVNTASYEDLAAVKGVTKKLAENIIASRPYNSLEDLLKVKGMGEKLLNKVRGALKL
jgi:competence ComEA-like helix-hairpin-helix protein